MAKRYTYVNGTIVLHEKAVVRADDIGLSRAFGVYDGIMTYNGKPFEIGMHFKRLSRSAKLLGLKVPVSQEELERVIITLVKKNSFKQPIVRVLLTGGTTLRGIDFDPKHPTFIVLLEELSKPSPLQYQKGIPVITHDYMRQIPEAKTINYIAAVRLQKEMRKAKAIEAIYTQGGKAFEATTSNLFVVKKGVISTPKDGILNGITRQVVMRLAQGTYTLVERPVTLKELFAADEVFLTSSFKEVLPVTLIDGKRVGKGVPGEVTKALAEAFLAYTK